MAFTLWDDNTHLLTVGELKSADGEYVNDAAVTATLTDTNGVEVPGETWPLSLVYDGGDTGTYVAELPSALEVSARDRLQMLILAAKGAVRGSWLCKITVKQRGC